MWQRVQTIFLLILALCMIVSLFLPSWEETRGADVVTLNALELEHVQQGKEVSSKSVFYIAVLAVAAAGIALYSITRYKNRLLQMKLAALNSLLMIGVLGLIMLFSNQGEEIIPNQQGKYLVGTYLPMAAVLLNLIARRFIQRDENLVRSSDRLR